MRKGEGKRKGHANQEGTATRDRLDAVALAQVQIRIVVELQKLIATLLRRIIASLPPSPEELDPEVDLMGVADARSEVRRVLQCSLRDDVEPLIESLLTAADYQPPGAEGVKKPAKSPKSGSTTPKPRRARS